MANESGAGSFLGTGWKFPPQVDYATGRMKTVSQEEDIAEAVMLILSTSRGARVMRPDFGSGINKFIFAEMNYTTVREMEREIVNAVTAWEPRVIEPEAEVGLERLQEGIVMISVRYIVRSTNNPYNLVFPYYINEGQ